jgi:hypothetical protein
VFAEMLGDEVQPGLAVAEPLKRAHRFNHIVSVVAGVAVPLAHVVHTFGHGQTAGILSVTAVDHVAKRLHLPSGPVFQIDAPRGFAVNGSDLLAATQIGNGLRARRCGDPVGNAPAHAAAIEPQHQAGLFRPTAMDERIDAERPMQSQKPRRRPFEGREPRAPHQRSVAEYPQVAAFLSLALRHHPR